MRLDLILRITSKILLPFIFMFAFYVHFHGDYSAGGGFQAGVMIAAGVVLHALIFGLRRTQELVPPWFVEMMLPLGVLVYAGVGVVTVFTGENYLGFNLLAHDVQHAQERGVILVEAGVIITVAAAMLAIFYAFADRGRKD